MNDEQCLDYINETPELRQIVDEAFSDCDPDMQKLLFIARTFKKYENRICANSLEKAGMKL